MALVDLTTVCTYLGVAQADLDAVSIARLQMAIDDISEAICDYTQKRFEPTQQTDYLDGGMKMLALRGRPVVSVLALYDTFTDGANPLDSTAYTLDTDTGLVYMAQAAAWGNDRGPWGPGLAWGHGTRRWRIDYTHGSTEVPKNVQLAALDCIKAIFNQQGAGVTAERIADYSYSKDTRGTDALTATAIKLLARQTATVNI